MKIFSVILAFICPISVLAQEVWVLRTQVAAPGRIVNGAGRAGLYLFQTDAYVNSTPLRRYLSSSNGIDWTSSNLPHALTFKMADVSRIIGIGDGGIWMTANGSTFNWILQHSSDEKFTGICFGNGVWVASSSTGSFRQAASLEGPWTKSLSPLDSVGGLEFGGGVFLASGAGAMLESTDGQRWQIITREFNDNIIGYWRGRFFTGSGKRFTAAQGPFTTIRYFSTPQAASPHYFMGVEGGLLFGSSDGDLWSTRDLGIVAYCDAVIFGGDLWVTATSSGKILTSKSDSSPPPSVPILSISTSIELNWPSVMGRQYQVKGSNDNSIWSNVGLPLLGNGSPLKFTAPANESRKFFRVEVR